MFGLGQLQSYLTRMLGTRNDAADANGSLIGMTKELRNSGVNNTNTISNKIGATTDGRSTVLGFLNAGMIKNIQRITTTIPSGSADNGIFLITAVNTAKSLIFLEGMTYQASANADSAGYVAASTNISNYFYDSSRIYPQRVSGIGAVTCRWVIVEFY